MSIALAAGAAFCFAGAGILFRRGVASNSIITAIMMSLPVIVVVTGIFAIVDWPDTVSAASFGWFVLGGVVGDGIGRAAYIGGVERLGPSRATPIHTAAYPFVAVLGGIVFLSEDVPPSRFAGAALIVAGIIAVTGSPHAEPGETRKRFRWTWWYLYPVVAGVGFGVSDIMRKFALDGTPNPSFGAAVGSLTALLIWALAVGSSPRLRVMAKPGPGSGWFVLAGVVIAIGLIAVFTALEADDVSVVGPIISAQPIVVVGLSALFLRGHEVLSARLVIGAVLTVAGVISLALT